MICTNCLRSGFTKAELAVHQALKACPPLGPVHQREALDRADGGTRTHSMGWPKSPTDPENRTTNPPPE